MTENKIIPIALLIFMTGLTGCNKEVEQKDAPSSQVESVTVEPATVNKSVTTPTVYDTSNDIQIGDNLFVEAGSEVQSVQVVPEVESVETASEQQSVETAPDIQTQPTTNSEATVTNHNEGISYGAITQMLFLCDGISQNEFNTRRNKGTEEVGFTTLSPNEYFNAFDEGVSEANMEFQKLGAKNEQDCAELLEFTAALEGFAKGMNEMAEDLEEQGWTSVE